MSDLSIPSPRRQFRHALVVYNPTAGARRRRRVEAVLDGLGQLRCGYELFRTNAPGDAEEIVRRAGDSGFDLIIAAGGDGTINEIANGLSTAAAPLPLAILPLGTANVLAAEIGLPATPKAVLATIAGGRIRSIRLGTSDDRHFVLMASAGLDSEVVRGISLELKRHAGQLAYGIEGLRRALSYPFPELTATIDGADYKARLVVVCKARCYGGPFLVAPQADLSDGLLHVALLERAGLRSLLRYGMALVAGKLPWLPDVRIIPATRVRVSGPMAIPVQADGDPIGCLPIEIAISDHRLELVVP